MRTFSMSNELSSPIVTHLHRRCWLLWYKIMVWASIMSFVFVGKLPTATAMHAPSTLAPTSTSARLSQPELSKIINASQSYAVGAAPEYCPSTDMNP